MEEASDGGADVGGNAVRQMFQLSTSEFGADKDFTTVVRCVERWAGVEVRAKKPKPG